MCTLRDLDYNVDFAAAFNTFNMSSTQRRILQQIFFVYCAFIDKHGDLNSIECKNSTE